LGQHQFPTQKFWLKPKHSGLSQFQFKPKLSDCVRVDVDVARVTASLYTFARTAGRDKPTGG
jgi:hypothetical protein